MNLNQVPPSQARVNNNNNNSNQHDHNTSMLCNFIYLVRCNNQKRLFLDHIHRINQLGFIYILKIRQNVVIRIDKNSDNHHKSWSVNLILIKLYLIKQYLVKVYLVNVMQRNNQKVYVKCKRFSIYLKEIIFCNSNSCKYAIVLKDDVQSYFNCWLCIYCYNHCLKPKYVIKTAVFDFFLFKIMVFITFISMDQFDPFFSKKIWKSWHSNFSSMYILFQHFFSTIFSLTTRLYGEIRIVTTAVVFKMRIIIMIMIIIPTIVVIFMFFLFYCEQIVSKFILVDAILGYYYIHLIALKPVFKYVVYPLLYFIYLLDADASGYYYLIMIDVSLHHFNFEHVFMEKIAYDFVFCVFSNLYLPILIFIFNSKILPISSNIERYLTVYMNQMGKQSELMVILTSADDKRYSKNKKYTRQRGQEVFGIEKLFPIDGNCYFVNWKKQLQRIKCNKSWNENINREKSYDWRNKSEINIIQKDIKRVMGDIIHRNNNIGFSSPDQSGWSSQLGLNVFRQQQKNGPKVGNCHNKYNSNSTHQKHNGYLFVKQNKTQCIAYASNIDGKLIKTICNLPTNCRLIYGGKQLDECTEIVKYNIQPNATINVVFRLKGGNDQIECGIAFRDGRANSPMK